MIFALIFVSLAAVIAIIAAIEYHIDRDFWKAVDRQHRECIRQQQLVIDMLMERELTGTWLPNMQEH